MARREQQIDLAAEARKQEKADAPAAPAAGEDDDARKPFVPWLGEARPRKGPIFDLEQQVGRRLTIEFTAGRVIEGTLVSYDRFFNLLLDDTVELLDEGRTRALGRVFSRGKVEAVGPTPQ